MASITALRGLTIGALARRTGVNIETIRYYERIGLVPPPPRTGGGHRSYAGQDADRLRFIRRARELGFGIDNIRTLLVLAQRGHASCTEARAVAAAHLTDVRAKQSDLAKLETILSETVSQCDTQCGGDATPLCPVLEVLQQT